MRRYVVTGLVAVGVGCGRLSFDPLGDANAHWDGNSDGRQMDPYAQTVIADGPVAYWRFEESNALIAVDEMGNYPGTFSGAVARGPGIGRGRGAEFDGSTTRLSIGDVFAFSGTAPYTLEVWARPSVIDSHVRFLIDRSSSRTPVDGYQLYYGSTFTLAARSVQGKEGGYASGPEIVANRWTHVVATYDGNQDTLYLDGVLINSTVGPVLPAATAGTFSVGDAGSDQFYKYLGVLDEVAIYPLALPAARVAAHSAAGR